MGSAIKMTYDFGGETPAYLAAIASAKTYTLSAEDYKTVWGVDGVEYLTPEQAPETALAKVLNKNAIQRYMRCFFIFYSFKDCQIIRK